MCSCMPYCLCMLFYHQTWRGERWCFFSESPPVFNDFSKYSGGSREESLVGTVVVSWAELAEREKEHLIHPFSSRFERRVSVYTKTTV